MKKRRIETSDGVELAVHLDGPPSAPPLTLVHSLATSSSMWDELVAILSDEFHIVRIDLPGHGQSQVRRAPVSFERLAQDVVDVWDTLGITSSDYLGLSLGGIIGAQLGLRHDPRLRRLLLADCRFDAPGSYVALWDKRRASMLKKGMEAIAEEILPTWLTDETLQSRPALVQNLRDGVRETSPDGWMAIVALFPGLALKHQLSQISVRTLVLCGDRDPVHDEMRECAALIPRARFKTISNALHLSNLDQPTFFADEALAFLAHMTGDPCL